MAQSPLSWKRTLSQKESLLGVFLSLALPVAIAGGSAFVALTASLLH